MPATATEISEQECQAIEREYYRRNLLALVQANIPNYEAGWIHHVIADELQSFFRDVIDKKSPRLMLMVPPRHGKTELASKHFPAWAFANHPDLSIIGASYASDLAARVNRDVQRIIDGATYRYAFPDIRLNSKTVRSTFEGTHLRNSEIFEIVGFSGSYRGAGVGQGITGMGADILIIDDPIKDAEQARSVRSRESIWEWYTSTAYTRLSPGAGVLVIMTRWHEDDLCGRLLDAQEADGDQWRVLRFPAIAEGDEEYRKKGEALHPKRYSLERLEAIRKAVGEYVWASLYQQRPAPRGGGMFPVDKFGILDHHPAKKEISASIRYWDKAGTRDGGAYTAGVLMHRSKDGTFVISDVQRGQWGALERERRIKQTAQVDGYGVAVWVEQEPGSGGKESAENTIRQLAGFNVRADRVTGDKESRAEPYAAQVQGGNVYLVRAEWNRAFLGEHETFPAGQYKDQVDAAAGAFAKLLDWGAGIAGLTQM
jgi:predicted phage terminase large subunit-like protein